MSFDLDEFAAGTTESEDLTAAHMEDDSDGADHDEQGEAPPAKRGRLDAVLDGMAFGEGDDADDDDAQEEPEAEEVEQPKPQGRKQTVPLGALQEERTKRQQAQQQVEAYQQQLALYEQQLAAFQRAKAEAEIPAFEDDPQGHIDARLKQLEVAQDGGQQAAQQQQQAAQQQAALTQLRDYSASAETEVRAELGESYDAASGFVTQQLEIKMRADNPAFTDQQVQRALAQVSAHFVQDCAAQGLNPARQLYAFAQEQGFQTKPAAKGYSGAPRPKYARSLSDQAGALSEEENSGSLDLRNVDSMSDEQFEKAFSKMAQSGNSANRIRFGGRG